VPHAQAGRHRHHRQSRLAQRQRHSASHPRRWAASSFFLPKYSPDLNPIEKFFAKLKQLAAKGRQTYRRLPSTNAVAEILPLTIARRMLKLLLRSGRIHPNLKNHHASSWSGHGAGLFPATLARFLSGLTNDGAPTRVKATSPAELGPRRPNWRGGQSDRAMLERAWPNAVLSASFCSQPKEQVSCWPLRFGMPCASAYFALQRSASGGPMTPSMTPGVEASRPRACPAGRGFRSGVQRCRTVGPSVLSNCCGTGGDETDGEETGADETDAGAFCFQAHEQLSLVASAFGRGPALRRISRNGAPCLAADGFRQWLRGLKPAGP